jgi:hypothetical protein
MDMETAEDPYIDNDEADIKTENNANGLMVRSPTSSSTVATRNTHSPSPYLQLVGQLYRSTRGKDFIAYRIDVPARLQCFNHNVKI